MNQPVLQRTAVDIIKRALRLLGVIDAELSLNDVDRDQGIEVLNDMVKAWQQQGFHLWTMSEAVLFLKQGQAKYNLGMGCTDAIKDGFESSTTTADYVQAKSSKTPRFKLNYAPHFGMFREHPGQFLTKISQAYKIN